MSDDDLDELLPRRRGRRRTKPPEPPKPPKPIDNRIPDADFSRLPMDRGGPVQVNRALLNLTPGKIRQHSARRRKGNLGRSQTYWLESLRDNGPMPELQRLLERWGTVMARQTLMAGFCVYIPFDKKPAWHITPAGLEALEPILKITPRQMERLRAMAEARKGKIPARILRGPQPPPPSNKRKYVRKKPKLGDVGVDEIW